MQVRVLGAHNLEALHSRHTCFLVDGSVAIDAGSLVTDLSFEEQDKISAILLTHRHFDHIRDVPSLGLATLDQGTTIAVHGLPETLEELASRLMDGVLYPDFTQTLANHEPKFQLRSVSVEETFETQGYAVRPIGVPHSVPAVGYIVHQAEGSSFAYCGDTGGGLLPFFQDSFKPDPLFIEVTFPDRLENRAKLTGHLTPSLLREELMEALKHKLAIPRMMIVHRSPHHEEEIKYELSQVSTELGVDIVIAHEGMTVDV